VSEYRIGIKVNPCKKQTPSLSWNIQLLEKTWNRKPLRMQFISQLICEERKSDSDPIIIQVSTNGTIELNVMFETDGEIKQRIYTIEGTQTINI